MPNQVSRAVSRKPGLRSPTVAEINIAKPADCCTKFGQLPCGMAADPYERWGFLGMGKRPIEFPRFLIEWAELERSIFNARDRNYLRVISGGEDFIRVQEILVNEGFFHHSHAGLAQ